MNHERSTKELGLDHEIKFRQVRKDMAKYVSILSPKDSIVIYLCDNKYTIAIIIADEDRFIDRNIRIIRYSSLEARQLLADIIVRREKMICYQNNTYLFLKKIYNGRQLDVSKRLYLGNILKIKQGGGIHNFKYEQVDALLYSPKTKRYEIEWVSYNRLYDFYFMDNKKFLKFVREYGYDTRLNLMPLKERLYAMYNITIPVLNEESQLHMFGYSVSSKLEQSTQQRQALLKELVNLQLLSGAEIVRHLEALISLNENKDNMQEACSKWKKDREFVLKLGSPYGFVVF